VNLLNEIEEKMRKIVLLMVIIFALPVAGAAQSISDSTKHAGFNPAADPFDDLKNAIKEAKRTNKRIILDIGGEWCIWCHRIDSFIEQNDEISNYLHSRYVVLKINYSKENKNDEFLAQYPKVDGYPHLFVLEKNGKLLHSQNTGQLEKEKSYDADKMLKFLKKWAPKKKIKM
jgi:thioredoxin-related protein